MAEGPRTGSDREDEASRLRDLEERLSKLTPKPKADAPMAGHDQAHLAWRMVIELVAGLGIGFGIGYGLDVLFGTMPIFMVVFIMLGLAAGVKTMLRSAREIQEKKVAEEADGIAAPRGGTDEGA